MIERWPMNALNERGRVILRLLKPLVAGHPHWDCEPASPESLTLRLEPLADRFSEEERSKQPSPFSLMRLLVQEFRNAADSRLMLTGAFGYDLLLQFDPIAQRLPREDQKTLHLFLCDDIYFMDRKKEVIERYQYDFERDAGSTARSGSRYAAASRNPKKAPRRRKSSPTIEPKSTWRRWKSFAKACARATTTKSFCGRPSARLRRKVLLNCFNAFRNRAPALRIHAADGRRTTRRRIAGNVRPRRRRGSKPAPSPAPRAVLAIPCATPKAFATY